MGGGVRVSQSGQENHNYSGVHVHVRILLYITFSTYTKINAYFIAERISARL